MLDDVHEVRVFAHYYPAELDEKNAINVLMRHLDFNGHGCFLALSLVYKRHCSTVVGQFSAEAPRSVRGKVKMSGIFLQFSISMFYFGI